MSRMELRSLLLKEVAAIIADDELTSEALKALKNLRHKTQVIHKEKEVLPPSNKSEVAPPCDKITECVCDVRQRIPNAIMRYERGEYTSQEEMLKRTERWI